MKDKVFKGFIIAASVAMMLIVYGTWASNMTFVNASVASGLVASAIGWLGFARDLRRDARACQTGVR